MSVFSNTFHILRPAKAPGFAYAWLELVSHRVFIGRMLAITPQQRVSVSYILAPSPREPHSTSVVIYELLNLAVLLTTVVT